MIAARSRSRWHRPDRLPTGQAYVFLTYRCPRDFPDGFVMRAFEVTRDGLMPADFVVGGTLADTRALMGLSARRIGRRRADHPLVYEIHY